MWSSGGAVSIIAALALGLSGCSGCGKKKEDGNALAAPPPQGAASTEELTVGIGGARAIDDSVAPSSTKWRRVIPIDDKRALVIGDVTGEAIAILTDDGGRSWKPLRQPRDGWANWSAGPDGTIVLALGTRAGAKAATGGVIETTKVSFGSFDKASLTPPIPLFPMAKGPVKGTLDSTSSVPFVLSGDLMAVEGEDGRTPTFFFGGRPGSTATPPIRLPAGEKIVPVPYGRPPMLVTVRGRDLLLRAAPMPEKPLDKPQKIPGLGLPPSALADLSIAPACEFGPMSFQKLKGAPKMQVVGITSSKPVAFALPEITNPITNVGCNSTHVVVETLTPVGDSPTGPQAKVSQLAVCEFDGKCVLPGNNPFRVWPEPHEQEIVEAASNKGYVAVLSQRAGDRWGLYLAQTADGKLFEMPRVIGEGKSQRGQLGIGALVSLGDRLIMLLSAEVTGTSRRGWYVMISDDGGLNWGPP